MKASDAMRPPPESEARHNLTHVHACCSGGVGADFYTPFSFDNAILQRSNLGGLGGRCTEASLCTEMQSVTQVNDLREVRFALVANSKTLDEQGNAIPIDLRVTNETEYRAWNIRLNGKPNASPAAHLTTSPNRRMHVCVPSASQRATQALSGRRSATRAVSLASST